MNLSRFAFALLVMLFAIDSWAVLPPKYLSIPHWKNCVDTATINGSYSYVCLPGARPRHCPPSSWRAFHQNKKILVRCKI